MTAFDLSKKQNEYDRNKYNVDQVQKDSKLISFALSQESAFKLNEDTKVRLEARQGRNISHLLLNSQKMFGDSKEMTDVKNRVKDVEESLLSSKKTPLIEQDIKKIEMAYKKAIAACQTYLEKKTNHNERYHLVKNKMIGLLDELGYITTAKERVSKGEELHATNGQALLILSKLDDTFRKREKTPNKEDNNVIPELTEKQKKAIEEDVAKLDTTARQIVNMLTLKSVPAEFAKKQGDDASDLSVFLYNLLKSFPNGAHTEYLHTAICGYKGNDMVRFQKDQKGNALKDKNKKPKINNTLLAISQSETGKLLIRIGQKKIPIPFDRDMVLERMQSNMIQNENIFGKEFTNNAFDWIKDANSSGENFVALRNACLQLLSIRTGMPSTDFNNLSTEEVRTLAVGMLNGMKAETVKEFVNDVEGSVVYHKEFLEDTGFVDLKTGEKVFTRKTADTKEQKTTSKYINSKETLELLDYREKNLDKLKEKVKLAEKPKEQEEVDLQEGVEAKWTEEESRVKNFLADLIFSKDTWKADNTVEDPGERMRKVMQENRLVLVQIIRNPNIIDTMIDKLPIPEASEEQEEENAKNKSIKGAIKESIHEILDNQKIQMLQKIPWSPAVDKWFIKIEEDFALKAALDLALSTDAMKEKLADVEKMIDSAISNASVNIQEMINGCVDELFKADSNDVVEEEIKSPKEKGIDEKEKKARVDAGNKRLEKMIEDSMKGSSGQGKFIKIVMQNYFSQVSSMDQRAMFASALRNANPSTMKLFEDSKKEDMMKAAGNFLGGVFKGAGPLFQKILQGLPIEGFPKEIQGAFKDVKSKLLPIPDEIVEAQLLAMVERSKGAVSKIEVTKALGAASVGQAFLCKIYGPKLPEEGKDVVVKLLRPDVRNRMMREKNVLLECASLTDAGMRKTYEGQLERIEEELDLTIEARNVQLGHVYDKALDKKKTSDAVSSMKLNQLIPATTNSMVLEKSPGTTVDKYMEDLDTKQMDALKPYLVYEKVMVDNKEVEKLVMVDGIPKLNFANVPSGKVLEVRAALSNMLTQLEKRQKHLLTLSQKWVEEGLFGEGFYHGDLHAGNIMIDDDSATVIDFGNATKLDDEQKDYITKMMIATSVGDVNLFRHGFHMLMRADDKTESFYQSKKNELTNIIKKTFSYGDAKSSGQRIGVILLKAQELGLELPSAIFNFSQCQLRLQNTVNDVNNHITKLQKLLKEVNPKESFSFDLEEKTKHAVMLYPGHEEDVIWDMKLSVADRMEAEDFIGEMRGKTEEERINFDRSYLDPRFKKLGVWKAYDYLKTINSVANDISEKDFKINAMTVFKELKKDCYQKLEIELGSKEYKAFVDNVEACKKDITKENIQKLMVQLEGHSFEQSLEKLRTAQDSKDPVPPEEMQKLEQTARNAFLEQCGNAKSKIAKNESITEIIDEVNMNLRKIDSTNNNAVTIKEQLGNYFKDETYGKQLETAYDNMVKILNTLSLEQYNEKGEYLKPFMKLFMKMTMNKVEKIDTKNIPKITEFKEEEPENFLNVMGNAILKNTKTLMDRMGKLWLFSWRKEISEVMDM